MIAYLEGVVSKSWGRQIILMTQGVGYLITIGNELLSAVRSQQPLELFIYTQVKEDDICLYGFREETELKFFKQLLTISGIGAKTAMTILDMPVTLTQKAILSDDVDYLSTIPGLGKKTAARLCLEMKEKVEMLPEALLEQNVPRSLQDEALEALIGLGYDKPTVVRFLNSTDESFNTAEDVVRSFLQKA
jgi:Holliday junction DNA helicase RuvA